MEMLIVELMKAHSLMNKLNRRNQKGWWVQEFLERLHQILLWKEHGHQIHPKLAECQGNKNLWAIRNKEVFVKEIIKLLFPGVNLYQNLHFHRFLYQLLQIQQREVIICYLICLYAYTTYFLVPMNKVVVGYAPSPNLMKAQSRIGSLSNHNYKVFKGLS